VDSSDIVHFAVANVTLVVLKFETCVYVVECSGGAVQLVNSNPDQRHVVKGSPLAGRVEMCLRENFRTICDDFWSKQEASLLCKELGFSEFGKKGHMLLLVTRPLLRKQTLNQFYHYRT